MLGREMSSTWGYRETSWKKWPPEIQRCSSLVFRSFPGGPVVKNLPHNAGNVGLIPGQGRSQMPQDNYWASVLQSLLLKKDRQSAQLETPAHRCSSIPLPQLEKASSQGGRPSAIKKKKKKQPTITKQKGLVQGRVFQKKQYESHVKLGKPRAYAGDIKSNYN